MRDIALGCSEGDAFITFTCIHLSVSLRATSIEPPQLMDASQASIPWLRCIHQFRWFSLEMHPSIEMLLTWDASISIQMDAGTRPLASFDSSEWVMSHTNAPDVIHVSYRRVSSEWVKWSKRLIRMCQMMWVVTPVVSRDSRCEPWFVSMSPVWDQWVVVGLHCKRHPSEIDADTRPFVCHPIQSWMMESGGSFLYTSCRGGGYIQPSPFARSDNFMERCRQSVSQLDRIIV